MKINELDYYEKSLLYTKFAQFIDKLEEDAVYDEKNADEHLEAAKNPDGTIDKDCWNYRQYISFTKEAEALEKIRFCLQDLL